MVRGTSPLPDSTAAPAVMETRDLISKLANFISLVVVVVVFHMHEEKTSLLPLRRVDWEISTQSLSIADEQKSDRVINLIPLVHCCGSDPGAPHIGCS